MAIENLQANKGILYKILSIVTRKDYYKTQTGATIKTDKGKGAVSYDTNTGEITCDGLQNAIIKGTAQKDKITVQNSDNVKVSGGASDDEFTIKYSDTVQIDGGAGNNIITTYDVTNMTLKNVEKENSVTTSPSAGSERDGIIDETKQGGIGDCWFLSKINSMSYTEQGRKIIKESIVWDDKNQQAIVHCKGIGVDMVVSYDELAEARENGSQFYYDDAYRGGKYAGGDDDMFLLEYAMAKLSHLEVRGLIDFEYMNDRPNPVEFLAGVTNTYVIQDEEQKREILSKLEADNGKSLIATAGTGFQGECVITDANGKTVYIAPSHTYAIKEVKNGLITVINPWESSEDSKYTMTLTYDDFCEHFYLNDFADLSDSKAKDSLIIVDEGSENIFSDYGIYITSGTLKISEFKHSDEKIIKESKMRYQSFLPSGGENDEDKILKFTKKIKDSINNTDEIDAFRFTDKDGVVHCFINDNGNIRYFKGDGVKNYNYEFVEEKEMTQDEFKAYLYSIIDDQEYVKRFTLYAD